MTGRNLSVSFSEGRESGRMGNIDNELAISVKNITKSFKVYFDKGSSLKEKVLFKNRNRYETRTVIKGVSFDVKKGEAIGFIGHNGCGKSTLLKMLTRIMYPDSGTVTVNGRVSSLIELGAGFHPDMSGRENIYTNASIFGLTKKEIDSRLQTIIDFSELAEYIDNPVRTYSSGMYMRLAFSVAINVDADVLMIDEILAVGDVAFQAKCFNKLKEIKADGTTIVIVSHSLGQIESICDRSIWIHDGVVRSEGDPKVVDLEYLDFMARGSSKLNPETKDEADSVQQQPDNDSEKAESSDAAQEKPQQETKRWGNGNARIKEIAVTDAEGNPTNRFATGDTIVLSVDYSVYSKVKNAVFGIGFFNSEGIQCYGTNTRIDRRPEFDLTKDGRFVVTLKNIPLLTNDYLIDIAIESDAGIPVDYYREAASISVMSPLEEAGTARIDHTWDY